MRTTRSIAVIGLVLAAGGCEGTVSIEDQEGTQNPGVCEGANCVCGDGYVSKGEECDDGNADSTDGCTTLCKLPACGDGFTQPSAGETCDDGGTSDGDACSSTCNEQRVSALVGGVSFTCAVLSGGIVKCWGSNSHGALGLGDISNRGDGPNEMGDKLPSVDLGSGKTARKVSLGTSQACALLQDGSVKCWGLNQFGALGLGDISNRGDGPNEMGDNLPVVDLGTGKTAHDVSVYSRRSACALLDDGHVKCWGENQFGQLGLGDPSDRGDGPNEMGDNLPVVNLGTGKIATAISAGESHACALLADGSVKCWGGNYAGQLGLGDISYRGDGPNEMGDNLPVVDFGTGKTAIAVSAGGAHTCALLNDGNVKCWGSNTSGELGVGDWSPRGDDPNEMGDNLPVVNLGTGKTAIAVSAGDDHTCAVLNDSNVKCWGGNVFGQVGLGNKAYYGHLPEEMGDNLPNVDLGSAKTATAVDGGRNHTCAVLHDGSGKCWGVNGLGTLGLGDTADRGDNVSEMGDNLPTVKLFSDLW